jgi:cyclopropane-fatty-acyl-phospholipid synthase
MFDKLIKEKLNQQLSVAGICFDGPNIWDPRVRNSRLYSRIMAQGTLGLGEAYMEGWWECEALDQFFYRVLRHGISEQMKFPLSTWRRWGAKLINLQTSRRAFIVGKRHYDVGNDLYMRMLDPMLIYSCGYWQAADNLADAQIAKLRLVFDKLKLSSGMRVLDIGCGWGGAARFAAQHYGVEVVGVSISQQQVDFANSHKEGLAVKYIYQDYRELQGCFDRVYSIGMFEHVGQKNYHTYLDKVANLLTDDGLFLLHTIGRNETASGNDPWVDRYIFPNGALPSIQQIGRDCEGRFVVEDMHNFGFDYDTTLLAWHENFSQAWPQLKDRHDTLFKRMWEYYLLSFAGAFRARDLQVWQWVLSPKGLQSGYRSPR